MPAVNIVAGGLTIAVGVGAMAATGGLSAPLSLGMIAAGATILGGAAMVAGGVKQTTGNSADIAAGQQWAQTGTMIAAAGSIGTQALNAAAASSTLDATPTSSNFLPPDPLQGNAPAGQLNGAIPDSLTNGAIQSGLNGTSAVGGTNPLQMPSSFTQPVVAAQPAISAPNTSTLAVAPVAGADPNAAYIAKGWQQGPNGLWAPPATIPPSQWGTTAAIVGGNVLQAVGANINTNAQNANASAMQQQQFAQQNQLIANSQYRPPANPLLSSSNV